jgi:hypothetical protein
LGKLQVGLKLLQIEILLAVYVDALVVAQADIWLAAQSDAPLVVQGMH